VAKVTIEKRFGPAPLTTIQVAPLVYMKAKDLRRGDDFVLKLSCRALSVKPVDAKYVE
jgi:hypothetical protein